MFQLPSKLQRLIYEFDRTKLDAFDLVLIDLNYYFNVKIHEIKTKSAYFSAINEEFLARSQTLIKNQKLYREIKLCLTFIKDDIVKCSHFINEENYEIFYSENLEECNNHICTNYIHNTRYSEQTIFLDLYVFKRKGSKKTRKKNDLIRTYWYSYVHNYQNNCPVGHELYSY